MKRQYYFLILIALIQLATDAAAQKISVFVKSSEKPVAERERAIAEVTRAIHDYFLLTR